MVESSERAPGTIGISEVNNEVVVEYSSADRLKAHDLTRVTGRQLQLPGVTRSSLKAALETTLTEPAPALRIRAKALELPPPGQLRSFQRNGLEQTASNLPKLGSRFGSDVIPPQFREVASVPGHIVIVKKPSGAYDVVFEGMSHPVEVRSMPALTEHLLDPAYVRPGKEGAQIHFAGFTAEEGDGLLRNVEFQAKAQNRKTPSLTGVVEKNGEVSPRIARAAHVEYDFTKVKISEPVLTAVEEGPMKGTYLFEAKMEVPSRIVSRPSLFMRIRIFFSQDVPAFVQRQVNEAMMKILARLGNEKAGIHVQASQMKREMMALHPDIARIEFELNDYYITELLTDCDGHPKAA
jgi:hypothetical protein